MASQAGRLAAPPADPRLVMPANVSAGTVRVSSVRPRSEADPGWDVGYALRGCSRALRAGSKPALASCSQVAAGGDRWLLMAVWGASRGHAPVVGRPGSWSGRCRRTTVRFSGRAYPKLARIVRAL